VTVQPWRSFAISVGIDVLWRYSTQDAFYQPPGVPLVPGSANNKRFLGVQTNLRAEWQPTPQAPRTSTSWASGPHTNSESSTSISGRAARPYRVVTCNTNFPRVWPATPRSNACRAFASNDR
jgi:hypothetical protein